MFSRASVGLRTQVPINKLGSKKQSPKSTPNEQNAPAPVVHEEAEEESEDPSLIKSFGGHKGSISAIALSYNLTRMASVADLDSNLFIWTFDPDLRGCKYIGHKKGILAVEFHPQGEILATGSKDNTIRVWMSPDEKEDDLKSLQLGEHSDVVRSVTFSKFGETLLSGSNDKTIKLWDIENGKLIKTIHEHTDSVVALNFNCADRLFASASDDRTVKVHDLSGSMKTPIHTLNQEGGVSSLKFHPVNPNLFACSVNDTIKLYDSRTFKLLQQYRPAHDPKVTQIDMSGQFLISSGSDGYLRIWDLFDQFLCYTLKAHSGSHTAVCFGPGGDSFASGGDDSMVQFWKTNFDTRPFTSITYEVEAREEKEEDQVPVEAVDLNSYDSDDDATELISNRDIRVDIPDNDTPSETDSDDDLFREAEREFNTRGVNEDLRRQPKSPRSILAESSTNGENDLPKLKKRVSFQLLSDAIAEEKKKKEGANDPRKNLPDSPHPAISRNSDASEYLAQALKEQAEEKEKASAPQSSQSQQNQPHSDVISEAVLQFIQDKLSVVMERLDLIQTAVISMEKRMTVMEQSVVHVVDAFRLANDVTPSPITPPGIESPPTPQTPQPYALTPGKTTVNVSRHTRRSFGRSESDK